MAKIRQNFPTKMHVQKLSEKDPLRLSEKMQQNFQRKMQ